MKRILLTGGGTGGSVTPLLAVAGLLRAQHPDWDFLFVGSHEGPEASLCEAANIRFHAIPAGKLRRYWSWRNLTDIQKIWDGWRAARQLMKQWLPDVTLSAGSFVSVPVVWAAKQAGSRVLIHQQDIRPGLANRLMAQAATIITVAFEQSLRDFPSDKSQLIGNPVRPEIFKGSATRAQELFSLEPRVPVLLVLGGGNGSRALNHLISQSAFRLVQHWQIIHLTGRSHDYPQLHDRRYHQYDFLTWQFPHALAAADLVMSRCGLGAISEMSAVRKPGVFIPLPGTHQEDNARLLKSLQAGYVIHQPELTDERLLHLLDRVRREPNLLTQWAENIHHLYHADALQRMADFTVELAQS